LPKDDVAATNTVQKSKLSVEINCLKEEYNKLKYKFINEQGIESNPTKVKLQASQLELLRKVIREKEQQSFLLRFRPNQ